LSTFSKVVECRGKAPAGIFKGEALEWGRGATPLVGFLRAKPLNRESGTASPTRQRS